MKTVVYALRDTQTGKLLKKKRSNNHANPKHGKYSLRVFVDQTQLYKYISNYLSPEDREHTEIVKLEEIKTYSLNNHT